MTDTISPQPKTRRTSAFLRIKPHIMSKSVENAVIEAITNRDQKTAEGDTAAQRAKRAKEQAAVEPTWPMPVDQFKDGHFLEPGDIVLSTKLGSFFSYLMKRVDKSNFAHASLVFLTPKNYEGVDRTYVLEATFAGVDLGSFAESVAPTKIYADTGKPAAYVVGIKRLEKSWFQPKMRPYIAGQMLRFIKNDDYNFSLLAALASRHSKFWFKTRDTLFGGAPTIDEFLSRAKKFAPKEFICSGFVQYAYVDMLVSGIEEGVVPLDMVEQAKKDVLFPDWATTSTSIETLMATKPAELANSPRLAWKYLVFDGKVHQVSSEAEAEELFKQFNASYTSWFRP